MEEDIKILKKAIKVLTGNDTGIKLNFEVTAQAIENILSKLEQLEKENTELKRMLQHRIKYTQELEEDLFENCSNYVVPKSVIREKIEELEKELPLVIGGRSQGKTYTLIINFAIKSLKELLGDEQ